MEYPIDADIAVMSHSELDEALRATELQLRSIHARRARILAAVSAAGSHQVGGHRTIGAYVRSVCNTSSATARKDHTLAKLIDTHPDIADSLDASHISVDHGNSSAWRPREFLRVLR